MATELKTGPSYDEKKKAADRHVIENLGGYGSLNRCLELSPQDAVQLRRFERSLTRAARSFTGLTMNVYLNRIKGTQSAESTDLMMRAMYLDIAIPARYRTDSERFVVTTLGLFYHGLSHMWFTPRLKNLTTEQFQIYNMLEDQRIETFSSAIYISLASYFRAAFSEMVMHNPLKLDVAYPLAAGRHFLDPKIREGLRTCFKYGPDAADEIDDVIESYKLLHSKTLNPVAIRQHIDDFLAIMRKYGMAESEQIEVHNASKQWGGKPDKNEGMPDSKDSKEMAAEALELMAEDEDSFEATGGGPKPADDTEEDDPSVDPDDEDSSDGTDDAEDDSDDATGDSDGSTGDDSDDDGSPIDGGDDPVGSATGETETGGTESTSGAKGASKTPAAKLTKKDIADAEQQVMDAIAKSLEDDKANEAVTKEIAQTIASMAGDAALDNEEAEEFPTEIATRDMEEMARAFGEKMLDFLSPDVDPGWDRFTSSGRVNPVRFMQDDPDPETIFDRWDEGHNDAFEVVAGIATDRSSSMKTFGFEGISPMEHANRGSWVIRRGLEIANATVRSLVYDAGNYTFVYGDDRVGHEVIMAPAMGGTHPADAIVDLADWMHTKPAKTNKVMFILTDGEWSDPNEHRAILERLQSEGITVVLVAYGSRVSAPHLSTVLGVPVYTASNEAEWVELASNVMVEMYSRINQSLDRR